ncbi:MAG: LysR substrate-binding domain-containing protein [Elsteraceae bacterium]
MRDLSRLKALHAFEASARHGGFTRAAAELNVTPAAVGQLVRSLEVWLGAPLFLRRGSGSDRLIPTDDALSALADLAEGLERLETGLRKLKARRARSIVTVTASQALVAKWLLPHLDDFAAAQPLIDVRLDVTDRLVDLRAGEADIGLRCGPGQWPGLMATHLMDEEVFPVCSPDLLPTNGKESADWLLTQTLIHDQTPAAQGVFPEWPDWLAKAGISTSDRKGGLRINAAAAVIQAAIKGHGVALARRELVARDIAEGRLRRLFPQIGWPIAWGYYVVATQRSLKRAEVTAFHDWLVARWRT